MRYLPGQVLLLKPDDIQPDENGDPSFPRQEGAAIWQFPGNSVRALFMRGMRQRGSRVLAEIDDDYLQPPPFDPGNWKLTRSEAKDGEHSYEAHRQIVEHECDGLIVSVPALARRYAGIARNIYVCPNSVDPADWPDDPPVAVGRVLRIGWAASDSHVKDAPLIRRALEWASKQPNVEVVLLGLRPPDWRFKLTHIPWTDSVAEYRTLLETLDVGLCPLMDNSWNRCKSDIKAMEYAMAGAMPIVSAMEAYKPWFGTAARCASAKDWEKVIRWAVLNRNAVAQNARQAREYVLRERTIQQNLWRWEEAVSTSAAPST